MSSVRRFRAQHFERVHRAARHVVRVFELDQTRRSGMRPERAHFGRIRSQSECRRRRNRARDATCEPRHHRELVIQDVGAGFADHFLAVLRVHLDGDVLPIVPVGTKSAASLPKMLAARSSSRLRWDLRRRRRRRLRPRPWRAHGRGGFGDGIASQIDHAAMNS